MNYRHAFHAGNFADVFKHALLARIIAYLKGKEAAFRVIDTHSGTGLYDLDASESTRTGEWLEGIARLRQAKLPDNVAELLEPYLSSIEAVNEGGKMRLYPGSPKITRHLLRKQDRLSAIEMHPVDARTLANRFAGDYQTRVIELDGWLALGAHVPPKEKRGMVLVDPPFEVKGEFERMVEGLKTAHRRWPGGTYAFWYPIKDMDAVSYYRKSLRASGIPKILDTWLNIKGPGDGAGLMGCGMVIVNPPYTLPAELDILLPALQSILQVDRNANHGYAWLTEG